MARVGNGQINLSQFVSHYGCYARGAGTTWHGKKRPLPRLRDALPPQSAFQHEPPSQRLGVGQITVTTLFLTDS